VPSSVTGGAVRVVHIRKSIAIARRRNGRIATGRELPYMKILLAVDGSPCSDVAVDEVGRRPWPEGSSVKVLNAFELPLPATPEGWALPPDYFDELNQAMRTQAQFIIDRALERLRATLDKTIAIEGQFIAGPPRSVILDEAERWGADLIVGARMATTGGNVFCWAPFRSQSFHMRSVPSR